MTENLLCCISRITTEDISPCKLSSKTPESSNFKNLLPPLQHVPNIKDSKKHRVLMVKVPDADRWAPTLRGGKACVSFIWRSRE